MTAPTVVVLGVGGLGCPAALALAEESRAALLPLRLVLVDPDRVEASNLCRQILFRDADVGGLKTQVAAARLRELVPEAPLEIVSRPLRFEAGSAAAVLEGAALVLDGTDDFATRFLANDACCARGIALVHGAALGWTGQLLTIVPGAGPCLRCLFEEPPARGALPTCAEAGVIAPLCGVVGAAMAAAAVEVLHGVAQPGMLHTWNALRGSERSVAVPRDPVCPACARASAPRVLNLQSGGTRWPSP